MLANDPSDIRAFFVYGTLQRGGSRQRHWPCAPLAIESATTRGTLHDLGPYPGLLAGDELIGGELWQLRADDVPSALRVLDDVEGATGDENEWYTRRAIECRTTDGAVHRAWCYFFAKPEQIAATPLVRADADGVSRWRAKTQAAIDAAPKLA